MILICKGVKVMAMNAELIGIGPYSSDLNDCMEYGPTGYENVEPGALVLITFFRCNSTDQSIKLADIFKIEAWDFNTFHIKTVPVSTYDKLQSLIIEIDGYYTEQEALKYVDDFVKCFRAGFTFLYHPNG